MSKTRWILTAFLLLAGCAPDVTGTWRYTWQVRDAERWHGTLTLQETAEGVTGTIGYPDEDPATLYGAPELRDAWTWTVTGDRQGDVVDLQAPAPNTAWDDPWRFLLTESADGQTLEGPEYAGTDDTNARGWTFRAERTP